MIELPTRRRLERRRERLYAHLTSILPNASVQQVESIMRQVHGINLKIRTYFKGGINQNPQELFIDPQEDNDITTQNTIESEVEPTLQDLVQIEAEIQGGEIQV